MVKEIIAKENMDGHVCNKCGNDCRRLNCIIQWFEDEYLCLQCAPKVKENDGKV